MFDVIQKLNVEIFKFIFATENYLPIKLEFSMQSISIFSKFLNIKWIFVSKIIKKILIYDISRKLFTLKISILLFTGCRLDTHELNKIYFFKHWDLYQI